MSNTNKIRQRIPWIDNLKGFLILLVILGHVLQYSLVDYRNSHIFNFIYSFHMPLFFMVSGFVSSKRNVLSFDRKGIQRRGKQLLVPYLLWGFILCLCTGIEFKVGLFSTPLYWFLLLLFFISLLMSLCQWGAHKFHCLSELVCVGMVFLLFILHGLLNVKVLSLPILHVHFIFYLLGWYLRKYENKLLLKWMVYPFGLLFVFLGWFYQQNSSPFIISFAPASIYFILSGLCGSFFFLILFKIFFNQKNNTLSHVGRLTLGIYVIHLIICIPLSQYLGRIVENYGSFIGILMIFTIVSLLSIGICFLIERVAVLRFSIGLNQ